MSCIHFLYGVYFVCVDLCAVFRLIVVLFCVMCVILCVVSYCSTTDTGLKPIYSQSGWKFISKGCLNRTQAMRSICFV
jgi:hypothetical protein